MHRLITGLYVFDICSPPSLCMQYWSTILVCDLIHRYHHHDPDPFITTVGSLWCAIIPQPEGSQPEKVWLAQAILPMPDQVSLEGDACPGSREGHWQRQASGQNTWVGQAHRVVWAQDRRADRAWRLQAGQPHLPPNGEPCDWDYWLGALHTQQAKASTHDRFLQAKAPGRRINFMAHWTGGLNCHHLGNHLKLVKYTLRSLTIITTLTPPVTPPAIMHSTYIICG